MLQLLNNEQTILDEQEYMKGFNDASLIAEYEPSVLKDVTIVDNASSSYLEGFFDFKEYYREEQEVEKELSEIEDIRQSGFNRENELLRE